MHVKTITCNCAVLTFFSLITVALLLSLPASANCDCNLWICSLQSANSESLEERVDCEKRRERGRGEEGK